MTDRTAASLAGIDAPRTLPGPMQARLLHLVQANTLTPAEENLGAILDGPRRLPEAMRARLTQSMLGTDDADIARSMKGIDDPRPVPPPIVARIEQKLLVPSRGAGSRLLALSGVAAVAILVLVASLAITRNGGQPRESNRAIPTIDVSPSVKPTKRVLGTKFTNPPVTPTQPGSNAGPDALPPTFVPPFTGDAPSLEPDGAAPFPFTRSTAASRADEATIDDESMSLLGSITGLLNRLLGDLGRLGSIRGLPADDLSMTPPTQGTEVAATPSKSASTTAKSRPAKAKRRAPKAKGTTASPAATKSPAKPLGNLPAPSTKPLITIQVPATDITISL